MRTPGLCLALIASAQLTMFSSPAFAQDTPTPTPPPDTTAPPPDTGLHTGSGPLYTTAPAPAPAPDAPAPTPATTTPAASATAATPAAPAPAPATATAAAPGTVVVHINSDTPVTLQKRANESANWETVCTSPCDTAAPVDAQYQVMGDGVNASKPFMLNSTKGKVVLDVSPGTQQKAKVGMYFLIGGAAFAVAGLITVLASSGHGFVSSDGNGDGNSHLGHTNGLFAGGALLFVGIGGMLYGGGTMWGNAHSTVEGNVAQPQPARGMNESVLNTAYSPVPNAPTFMLPVLSGKF